LNAVLHHGDLHIGKGEDMGTTRFKRVFYPILILLLVSILVMAEKPSTLILAKSRKSAPDFTLRDSAGTAVKLSDYRGMIVLLDFWATWCHGCMTEIPWYIEFQKKYRARGLMVIGVSMDDDGWKSVKPFIAEHDVNYPVVIGNENLAKQYAVEQMPVTLLIDETGRIAESHSGVVNKEAFEADIRTLLSAVTNRPR
jgi:peroxiredoxin